MAVRKRTKSRRPPRRVVFLVFPGVALLDLAGPWEVFWQANRLAGRDVPPYRLELVGGEDDPLIRSDAGMFLASQRNAASCRGAIDTLIVPAADMSLALDPSSYAVALVRRLSRRSRRVVSVCAGAFYLAAAGLLDGRVATTHWLASKELSERYPEVDVQADSIFVKDGNVYTSAGVTAGIDLALALVEEDLGRELALECARHLVVFMRRPGGQSQFSTTLESQHVEDDAIGELVSWASDNLDADLSVAAMAKRARMSSRNFSRVFRKAVGETPAAFIEKLRVEAARRLLEDTELSIAAVADACGFGSADSMRRSFRRLVEVAPSQYRGMFAAAG